MKLKKQIIDLKKKFNQNYLSLHEPNFDLEDRNLLDKCLKSTFVSTSGNFIEDFEKRLKKFTGAKYVVALNSGTSALHMILIALGVSHHDEVLLPSATFVGTVNPILYLGAKPIFVDINYENLCICPLKLNKFLHKNYDVIGNKCINKKNKSSLKAIIYVNLFGSIGDIEEVNKIARKFKIKLIEDAAEAFGSFKKNKHAGLFSEIGALSFNGNKIITTGSGGAIITNNYLLEKKN